MKKFAIAKLIPSVAGIAGILCLFLWYADSPADLQERVSGTDGRVGHAIEEEYSNVFEGTLQQFDGTPAEMDGSWPRFRGENSDAVFTDETVRLATQWPQNGPELLWDIEVGEGYAGAAVLNGRVYVLDYYRDRQADVLRCLSLADGMDIWQYSYPVKVKRNHGMSRTVPAVTDKYVVSLGPKCHVICLDSQTGRSYWAMDLVKQFGSEVPMWYAGQCPIIDRQTAIIAPAGSALMIAVDCATGEIIWQTPNPDKWKMTHSSIMPMEYNGQRMFVYCGSDGVVGVSAENGKVLWQTTEWKLRINTPSPLIIGDGRIFLSAGYNKGSMMVQLIEDAQGSGFQVETLFHLEPEIFGAAQHTPILFEGYIYGVRPDEQMVCLDLSGNVIWTSGSDHKFGIGPFTIADGMIYAMDDHGLLRLIEAKPDGYQQLAEAQVLDGPDSWGPMACAGNKLILRDMNRMKCLLVGAN